MKVVTEKNFGVIIAFLLPGFLFLWGLSHSSEEVAVWLSKSGEAREQTVGGFLYVALASLAFGLLISAVRWAIIDQIHHLTGVKYPEMNFANLKDKDRYAAFIGTVENHYRYYQYYSNTLVAILSAFVTYLFFGKECPSIALCVITGGISAVLFLGSRDCLRKYYKRASAILE